MTGFEQQRRSDSTSLLVVVSHVAVTYTPVYLAAATGPSWLLVVYCALFGWLTR